MTRSTQSTKPTLAAVLISVLLITFGLFAAMISHAQTGYIYVHQKNINEESSVDFSFNLKNNSGTTVNTWKLNDQPAADNVANPGYNTNFSYLSDLGAGHGTGGDGQLWAMGNVNNNISNRIIYYRNPGSSQWNQLGTFSAGALDGAYANQCVISQGTTAVFYYNGSYTNLPALSASIADVTANNGRIAALSNGTIYLYSNSYSPTAAPATSGTWTALVSGLATTTRIDMNISASYIAYISPGSNAVNRVSLTGTVTSLGNAGDGAGSYTDIAYDDNDYVYATSYDASNGGTNVIASYNGSTWKTEPPSREIYRLTAGVAHSVWGVEPLNVPKAGGGVVYNQPIWYRATDNTGTAYWVDDERVKTSASLNGNGIMIPVSPGTYTIQETLPTAAWDLGRFNLYDPGGAANTQNVKSNFATVTVTAGEVVYVEFVNELLDPVAIPLNCTQSYLQSFDSPDFGTGSYSSVPFQGTSYHFFQPGYSSTGDGRYSIVQSIPAFWDASSTITDHTANGGYMMLINASYSKDEFFRQRVTNLKAGVTYVLSFWTSNISPGASISPNIFFGLQDTAGVLLSNTTTGNLPNDKAWHQYSFTFTATSATADVFLRNQNIGGNGNDLVIDDIALIPYMAPPNPNVVAASLCAGSSVTAANSSSGGVWTINPTSVATINFNTGVVTGVAAGSATLTYTLTNAIGCTATATNTITVSPKPTVVLTRMGTGNLCINQKDSLFAAASSGTAPYAYAWTGSPSATAGLSPTNVARVAIMPSAANSYTYTNTVTDANGCTATGNITVTVNNSNAPTVNLAASGSFCNGGTIVLTATVTPAGTYTYGWGGTPAGNGLGSSSTNINSANPSGPGTYTYNVAVVAGSCQVSASVTLNYNNFAVSASSFASALCTNTADSVYSTVTGGNGPFTYGWAVTAGPAPLMTIATPTAAKSSVSGGTAGSAYTFLLGVVDSRGCRKSSTVVITPKNVTGPTISNMPVAGTICINTAKTLTPTITAGSGAISTYLWTAYPTTDPGLPALTNTSSLTVTPTVAGSYTYNLKVTDANGCAIDANSGIQTVNAPITVAVLPTRPVFCSSADSMLLTAVASGGSGTYNSYVWSTGAGTTVSPASSSSNTTTASVSASGSFQYSVMVTDVNGCTGSGTSASIPVGSKPVVGRISSSISSLCYKGQSFTLSAGFNGGTSPYNYIWSASSGATVATPTGTTSPVSTTATVTGAGAYVFNLAVTDANGCTTNASTGFKDLYSSLTVSLDADKTLVCANPGTTVNLTGYLATPTTSPYTYAWGGSGVVNNTSSITTTAVPAASGNYTLTVTDALGCSGTATTPLPVNVDQASPSVVLTCGTNSNGIAYGSFYENNGVNWLWTTNGAGRFYTSSALSITTDSSTSHLQAPYIVAKGNYTVTITNSAGCIGSFTYPVTALSCATVLADSKLELTATKKGSTALLSWFVLPGNNIHYFKVERSADGVNWIALGNVNASNTEAYAYTDASPVNGNNYYRITMVNNNGQVFSSTVQLVKFTGAWLVKLYPNPAKSYAVLDFDNDKEEKGQITLLTNQGSVVLNTESLLHKGANHIIINGLSNLAQGVYTIKLITATQMYTVKLVKGD